VRSRTHRRPSLVNVLLVPVSRSHRPALPISEHAELAAAFARGEERRASAKADDDAHLEWLMGLSSDATTAYSLGHRGPEALQAPEPIVVAVAVLLAQFVVDDWLRRSVRRRDKIAAIAIGAPALLVAARLRDHEQQRRARALGLTAETAPLPPQFGLMTRQFVVELLLVGVQQLRVRHRTGQWGRTSAPVDGANADCFGLITHRGRAARRRPRRRRSGDGPAPPPSGASRGRRRAPSSRRHPRR
jgi:hypothetical protein